ncbi:hypothetical protein TEA_011252 [Camellia sinensis var. sinensis]|uniref:Leucine-rich repeat-containing N-terminal plant-type domain-containing protein n=1 Tax=Camellia sinensis var. sinensis TaxID=542762 RepID=A0A4S4E775_CAMSN|nr:hypothetical protein TEA_011252 [Camellia sinensis var. sinensis]
MLPLHMGDLVLKWDDLDRGVAHLGQGAAQLSQVLSFLAEVIVTFVAEALPLADVITCRSALPGSLLDTLCHSLDLDPCLDPDVPRTKIQSDFEAISKIQINFEIQSDLEVPPPPSSALSSNGDLLFSAAGMAPQRHRSSSATLFGRMTQSFRGTPQGVNLSFVNGGLTGGAETLHQVEAKYPALLFKQGHGFSKSVFVPQTGVLCDQEGLSPLNFYIEEEFHHATCDGAGGVRSINNYAPSPHYELEAKFFEERAASYKIPIIIINSITSAVHCAVFVIAVSVRIVAIVLITAPASAKASPFSPLSIEAKVLLDSGWWGNFASANHYELMGVTCNEVGSITRIDFSSSYSLPRKLENMNWASLPNLEYLNLSNCFSTGSVSIPDEIGTLSKLMYLDLSYNYYLQGLLTLTLGNLTQLVHLNIKLGASTACKS